MAEPSVEARLSRLNALLEQLEADEGGELGRVAVSALADLYGAALARVLGCAQDYGAPAAAFTADPLVSHLMVLHGLHPDPADVRIRAALRELPAELVGVTGGVAELRVSASGCGAARAAQTAREAVLAAAPELSEVLVSVAAPPAALIAPESLLRRPVST